MMKEYMKFHLTLIVVLFTGFLSAASGTMFFSDQEETITRNASEEVEAQAVRQLLYRLIPEKANQFEIAVNFQFDVKDAFQIEAESGKILITGNRGYSAAAGVHHYLKVFCKCHVSWTGEQLHLPDELPMPNQTLKIQFHDKYRYYQNVCTSSYSFVWWVWHRWEKELDWMALNGINIALAFTAQEAIFTQVFRELNFTKEEIDEFFTGPAYLAWNRMGNVQKWIGPLSDHWHHIQVALQHKILKRMRDFGMIPVLPAFSGRVLPSFKRKFPNASTTYLNKTWGNFQPPFTFVTFLEPSDPLFQEIGSQFLRNYIKEFGTDHIYNADFFNEMPPPSKNPDYLHYCSKSMFKTLTAVDPEAIWMIQGWMFYSDLEIWKPAQSRAFLRAVPLGKMIVLDLQSELYPQYHRLNSYYGQPFIWCMLHNYGGVNGLYGSLDNINSGPFEGRNFLGTTMVGTGLTPEGIGTNDLVYELMNEMAWRSEPVDLQEWLNDFSLRRYGKHSSHLVDAYQLLKRSVYNATVPYRNHGKYILTRRPSLKLKPYIWYDPNDVFKAWTLFLNASKDRFLVQSPLYRHDLVDLTRQSLQLTMDILYPQLVSAFRARNVTALRIAASWISQLFYDMDRLLSSNHHFLLGVWIRNALRFARSPVERLQYEYNAKNQLTLWGPNGELVDYASKQWAGLMSQYYRKRWKFFAKALEDCLAKGWPFRQDSFNVDILQEVETKFDVRREVYPDYPQGDSVPISRRLWRKYGRFIEL